MAGEAAIRGSSLRTQLLPPDAPFSVLPQTCGAPRLMETQALPAQRSPGSRALLSVASHYFLHNPYHDLHF